MPGTMELLYIKGKSMLGVWQISPSFLSKKILLFPVFFALFSPTWKPALYFENSLPTSVICC